MVIIAWNMGRYMLVIFRFHAEDKALSVSSDTLDGWVLKKSNPVPLSSSEIKWKVKQVEREYHCYRCCWWSFWRLWLTPKSSWAGKQAEGPTGMRSLQAEQFFRGRSRVIERQTDRHTHTHTPPQERDMDICWLPCPLLPPKLSNEMPVWNRRKRAEDCGAELLHVEVCIRLFVSPWTVAHQAPVSMGFPRQEYWSGLLFSSPGDPPDSGI